MIDGTVQSMNANILIIDGMNVEVAPNTRLLNVIRIGDLVHVEDNLVVDGDTPRIVAVYLTILDMDVAIDDNGVVRHDAGDCRNPPSPWAPATGWRRRCGGVTGATGSQGVGDSGMGGE